MTTDAKQRNVEETMVKSYRLRAEAGTFGLV